MSDLRLDVCLELRRWLSGKELTWNAGDLGSISGSGRSPGEGNGNPVQYSCLGNPMDRGAWQAIVHRVERIRHKLVTKPSTNVSGLNKSKAMTNLESILKSRHYFANKGLPSQSYGLSSSHECES